LLYLNQFSRENFVRYGNPFQETISRIFEILNLLFRSIATQPPQLKFYRRLGKKFLQAFLVHCLGLLEFHDEKIQYHRSHPKIQALDRKYKEDWVKDLIFEAFGWRIHDRSNPIEFLHDIFKRLGINTKLQGRRTILGKRELFYQTVEDDALTTQCLDAAGRRLLEQLAVKKKVYKLPVFNFADTDWSKLKAADPSPQEQGEAGLVCGVTSEGRG
jgi:hypothetical protein